MPARRAHAFPHPGHDHSACTARALTRAEALCAQRGARLTAVRRTVLSLVWQSHTPVGAYALLSQLNGRGGRVAPMAVYRALEFLIDQGLVHRIASLNAYVGCAHAGRDHAAQFLICRGCGTAAELESAPLRKALARAVADRGFSVDQQIVEISGVCAHCRKSKPRRTSKP